MPDLTFTDLVEIYRATRFDADGEGILTIGSEHIVQTLRAIIDDDLLYGDAQISVPDGVDLVIGAEVPISVGRPNMRKMGRLVSSFDELFQSPGAAFEEPPNYYVIDVAFASSDEPAPAALVGYRAMLSLMSILRDAATLVNETMGELIFIGAEKVVVPIGFVQGDLAGDFAADAERLRKLFEGELHLDEKRTILVATLTGMVAWLRKPARFGFILRNIDRIADEVEKGYRLFTSSFSYSKIRNDVETARIDFVGKIHKTIVDVQGQLLGIPVATVVVVSQMKRVTGCDQTYWTNIGVLVGAWIFVLMLAIAGWNQWKTLAVINQEVERQSERMANDLAAVGGDLVNMFDDLTDRIWYHRAIAIAVGIVLSGGAIVATVAFFKLLPSGRVC